MVIEINDSHRPANEAPIDFPVVGIGASAGGLNALSRLLDKLPIRGGMAYVVILHLSPEHHSAAATILQRVTRMPVLQVQERIRVHPDHVYVIAPNVLLTMEYGHLDVAPLCRPPGQHTAIDLFFRTLAQAHRDRAVAVILSGNGADGAVGLERVKELGGLALVQDPVDCEHDGMPLAAMATGMVDFVLPAEALATKLCELWASARSLHAQSGATLIDWHSEPHGSEHGSEEDSLQRVIAMLFADTGHDFRHYKRATVLRRIERRMMVNGVASFHDYAAHLDAHPDEFKLLLKDLLISVTNFFRDPDAFDALAHTVIPDLFRDRPAGEPVRVWVAACATGQEAYSLAMLLADARSVHAEAADYQVFASDIDEYAIDVARIGKYTVAAVTDIPAGRLQQYFTKDNGSYRIQKAVRDRILFASHNLLRDPPFSRLDMISCRNLLIYLTRDMQARVLETFHAALKPNGLLFLGSSETVDAASEFFVPFDKKNRIYRARILTRSARALPSLASPPTQKVPDLTLTGPQVRNHVSFGEVHERALAKFAPPSLIINRDAEIVHMSATAARFLRHIGGEPSRNVLALVLPELKTELRMALYQALQTNVSTEAHRVMLMRGEAAFFVNMIVRPFEDEPANDRFLLVVFEEMEKTMNAVAGDLPAEPQDLVVQLLEAELHRSKERLQDTIDRAEESTDALRVSNEELQVINEELRSATEELETSKEELQSVNEELITVNFDLKVKVEETGKANDDLNNLIASTEIATIFVNRAMRINRFTPRAMDIFSIIPSDIGRSLFDITHRLDYSGLAEDVSTTFETLRVVEREIRTTRGRYFLLRIVPYRTTEDRIDGAVITFIDITERREAETKARISEQWVRLVAESTDDFAIITTDNVGLVTTWNTGAERNFGYTAEEMLGHTLDRIFTPEDRVAGAPQEERDRARQDGRAEDERWHLRKDGSRFFCAGVMTTLHDGEYNGYAKIARDQTLRVEHDAEREVALSHEQATRTHAELNNAMKDEFLAVMSHELRHPLNVIYINAELLARVPAVRSSSAALRSTANIRDAVTSQAKIIEDLMDMSRVATGKLALALQEVDLVSLTSKLVTVMGADPAVENLALRFTQLDAPVIVTIDPVRIEQIILNLLSNAIKFTPAGGVIDVTLCIDGNEARLDVQDTGAGITSEFLGHVFDMFGQGTATALRSKAGLGIGLALVRQIAELHGGRVGAVSEGAGHGSTFTLWLPLSSAPPGPGISDAETTSASINGLHLLLVDDSESTSTMFQELLASVGAHVEVAASGQQALDLLQNHIFDAVITDISMPDMDGFDFIRVVRAKPDMKDVPIIAASGLSRDRNLREAQEAGFSEWLTKPISLEILCDTVAALCK